MYARRRRLHGARGAGRRDGRRQAAVEQAVEIADAERAEHEDLGPDAGGAQRRALLDIGARQQIGAGVLERARDLAAPCPYAFALTTAMTPGGRRAARSRSRRRRAEMPATVDLEAVSSTLERARDSTRGATRQDRITIARREVLEARELADERELDDAGRAVALLADDQLRDALRVGRRLRSCRRTDPRGR